MKNKKKILIILIILFSVSSLLVFTYGRFKENVTSGVVGDTLYINDLKSDYYYYTGQNYTNSTNGAIPTLINKELYSDNNLAEVTITYSGTDINDSTKVGYVSLTEQQSKLVYMKYYPVKNGQIEIELIDNPFNDRPNDKVFNGWTTNYEDAYISFDSDYYVRYLTIPATGGDEISLTVNASWINEEVTTVSNNRNFNTAFSDLKNTGMNLVETTRPVYGNVDITGLYKSITLTTTTIIEGWFQQGTTTYGTCTDCYNQAGNHYNNYQCPAPSGGYRPDTYTNTCTMYKLVEAEEEYDINTTYYALQNGQMRQQTLQPTIIGYDYEDGFSQNTNMAGYYKRINVPRNGSNEGLYDASGNALSGTCTTNNGCTSYDLVQYSDNETPANGDQFYYLTTRDTNIIVMHGTVAGNFGTNNKPFTLTGINNGNDYNAVWNVSNAQVTCYNDTRIEELTIYTTTARSNANVSSSNANRNLYGNYNNVKLGRNIKQNGNYVNFTSVMGARNETSTVGSSSNPRKYKLVIESGVYNSTSLTYGATTGTTSGANLYTEMYGVYGNDYDRATNNNNKLILYYCASGSWGGRIHSSNDTITPALNTIVKSGTFGASKYDETTGIYVGGRYGGTHYAPRSVVVEGGSIYNLIGGPLSSNKTTNDTFMYIKGGNIDLVTGGAGTSTTYGNRIIQVTSGTINYGVIGGSNGINGTSSDGTLNGDSYVYIGGNAIIGNDTLIQNNNSLYGVASGTVFGAGNGNNNYNTVGTVLNTNVVVNDEALIKGNLYGSGNYGTVGYNTNNTQTRTSLLLLGGTINNVYGSGNMSGSGSTSTSSTIEINQNGSQITGNIYGGSNESGTVNGSVNINLLSGDINSVYGGGRGQNTYVARNVTITANGTDLEVGSIYGGSAFGTVNATTKNTTRTNYQTNVNIQNGNIQNVFGGGEGNNNYNPYVAGDVNVNVNGGTITNLYGGNDESFQPNGTVTVNLNDGTIQNAFGGGNNTLVTTTHINQYGSTVTNLYGGSNQNGNVETTNVLIAGGNTGTIFGGNKIGGSVATTNVNVNSGTINNVYGGGEEASTTLTNVNIYNNNGTITGVYGGGFRAPATTTNVNLYGGNISDAFGGSNQSGNVTTSNISTSEASNNQAVSDNLIITNLYGGNNVGGTVTTSEVNLEYGNITNAYGGGMNAYTQTTNIDLNGATLNNIFGGGMSAGVKTTNLNLIRGQAVNGYGGSNQAGEVESSNVKSNNGTASIDTIYGGNNDGGEVISANLDLSGGTYTNIYGGGNNANTEETHLQIDNITCNGELFGGGNNASVSNDVELIFQDSTINGDIFGGGNLGAVYGNTNVLISSSQIGGSVYAGGNGQSATVVQNTILKIEGDTTVDNHVFGGGNAANTGLESVNGSVSEVNIAGGQIAGNVYGGANTAKLFGEVFLNIGASTENLTRSDIVIGGTVFGGGEANASGDTNYDFTFISVTTGINIDIDGQGYNNFSIAGSIFGGGNASSTSGYSYVNISNYGTFDNYKENISIQRAQKVTMKNSAIKLEGAVDRNNDYGSTKFSISRVEQLVLANGSTLFLDAGANLLEKFSSMHINGNQITKANVVINDGDITTINANNRVYMLEGKNLNIAKNQSVTDYGEVDGMAFFGMYQKDGHGRVKTAFYSKNYNPNDLVTPGLFYTFSNGSYVEGLHETSHNTEIDGFYSYYEDEESEDVIYAKYIEPTPPAAANYIWSIGEEITSYDLSLTASRYSTLGTYELALSAFSAPNTIFQIVGFNYNGRMNGLTLVDKNTIPRNNVHGTENTQMGLTMEASNAFITQGTTDFNTDEQNPYEGVTSYKSENSSAIPSFLFYLYHSKNLSVRQELGTVTISLVVLTPVDDLNNTITRVNVNVNLSTAIFTDVAYEGAMAPGAKHEFFASTTTNITDKSKLSAYYSLFMERDETYYASGYYHVITSSYALPINTKITMIDLSKETDIRYYYYTVTEEDYNNALSELVSDGECSYLLSKFIAMGSTSASNKFNESNNTARYYDEDAEVVSEEFIFTLDFEENTQAVDHIGNTLLLEMRNGNHQSLIGVLGIEHTNMTYNMYTNKDAVINLSGTLSNPNVYMGDKPTLSIVTDFVQPVNNTISIFDTTFHDQKLGVMITICDTNGVQLNNSNLLGLHYTLDGRNYYPRMDGSVRIPLADRVANVLSNLKISTEGAGIASGDYYFKIVSFGSADGIYYGSNYSDEIEVPFTVIDSQYGFKVDLPDKQIIIDKTTGTTMYNNNLLSFDIRYSSNLENPNFRLSLYRRKYDQVQSMEYEKVNLLDYITNNLTHSGNNIYILETNPPSQTSRNIYLKNNLTSGTYKFEFELYDGDVLIGDVPKYVIIK